MVCGSSHFRNPERQFLPKSVNSPAAGIYVQNPGANHPALDPEASILEIEANFLERGA